MREIIKYQQIVWKKWQQKSRLFEDWSPKRQPLNLPLKRGWVDTWYQQAIKRQPANGIPHLPCRAGGSTSKSSVQPHVTIKPILVCIDSWLQHVGRENVDCTKHDPGPSEKSALPQPSTPHVQLTNLEYIWANQSKQKTPPGKRENPRKAVQIGRGLYSHTLLAITSPPEHMLDGWYETINFSPRRCVAKKRAGGGLVVT